jgi:hypothetical protein
VEDVIDEIVLEWGADDNRFIITTSHSDQTLNDVLQFARRWSEPNDPPQEVRLEQSSV